MCYRTGKYTVCRRVSASFSPEILQAGAVKGFMARSTILQLCACAKIGLKVNKKTWCFTPSQLVRLYQGESDCKASENVLK